MTTLVQSLGRCEMGHDNGYSFLGGGRTSRDPAWVMAVPFRPFCACDLLCPVLGSCKDLMLVGGRPRNGPVAHNRGCRTKL